MYTTVGKTCDRSVEQGVGVGGGSEGNSLNFRQLS